MDQVRKVLTWFKEQHFWVLSVVVAAIALWCWYSSAGALHQDFQTNEGQIKTQFTAVDGVASQAFIANEDINAKQEEAIKAQKVEVGNIWQQLYDRQSQGVLKWPQALDSFFHEKVKDLKFGDEMTREMRDEYLNYIDRHFPELPKKIGARELPPGEMGMGGGVGRRGVGGPVGRGGYGGGREGGGGGAVYGRGGGYGGGESGGGYGATSYGPDGQPIEDDDYITEWLDQGNVREELNFGQRPSSLEIWVTQENLWVYHTLLNIIANTNAAKGADRISNAAVRRIFGLQVGQTANQADPMSMAAGNRIWMPPSAAPALDPMALGGDMGLGEMGGAVGAPVRDPYSMGGEMGMEGGGTDERTFLLNNRYLGVDGQPIAVSSPTPTPGEFGREYKRLPIRMELEMDVRWLPRLIAECANQPLQVEVKEVRINPSDTGGMSGGGGYGRVGGGEGYGRGPVGGMSGGGAASPFPSDSMGEIKTFKAQPHVGTVVLQGIIYIFNPPDMDAPAEAGADAVALSQ